MARIPEPGSKKCSGASGRELTMQPRCLRRECGGEIAAGCFSRHLSVWTENAFIWYCKRVRPVSQSAIGEKTLARTLAPGRQGRPSRPSCRALRASTL